MTKEKPKTWEYYCYASDESGKGDFYGGPVVAAVYLNEEILVKLKNTDFFQKIRDSKKCSDFWIKKNGIQMMEILGKNYEYCIIKPKEYNELYSKYQNMNIILSLLHNEVHSKLKNRFEKKPLELLMPLLMSFSIIDTC